MRNWEIFLKVDGWHSEYSSVDKTLRHYARRIKSEKTREIFCGTLMQFCKYCGMGPEELVNLSVEEASKLCQGYTNSLMDKDSSIRYVNSCQAYLKTFFRENGFERERELKTGHYYQPARYRKRLEYIPMPDEVYKMAYASGSAKNRSMIFALYTAGLRNSTLRAIKYGDVKEELEKGLNVIKIEVYPEMKKLDPKACKGDIPYYTFVDSTTVKTLREYLEERREKFGSIEDEEPLFCSDSNALTPEEQRRTLVSPNGLEEMVKNSAKRSGLEKWQCVTPKCLGTAYESALCNNGLDPKDQEFLMGHILPGSQDPYYDKSKVEELRRKYAQVSFFPQRGFITEEIRKKQLLDTAKLLGFGDERLRQFQEILARAKTTDEAIEKFKRLKDNPEPKENNNIKVVKEESKP